MATLDQGVLPRALTLQTPGKINLTLRVRARRADGFHELESVVVGVGLFDTLNVTVSKSEGVIVKCDDPSIDERHNLAAQAARALMRYGCASPGGVRIDLQKRIPLGAGLGGGSADAAATLRLCNELWGAGLADSQLADVGASIGSDIPLFFHLPCALMTGRGERVERLSLGWRGWVLLMSPPMAISTRDVYESWRAEDSAHERSGSGAVIGCVRADELSNYLFNDLEPAVFRVCPALGALKHEAERHISGSARVTGSGSTLFQLFDEYDRAVYAAKTISRFMPGIAVTVVEAPVALGDPESQETQDYGNL